MKNIESLADCLTQNNFSLPPDTNAIVLLFLLMLLLLFSAASWAISPIIWNKIILIWNQLEFEKWAFYFHIRLTD